MKGFLKGVREFGGNFVYALSLIMGASRLYFFLAALMCALSGLYGVVQAVFLRLWKRRPDFADEAHAKHWLLRLAINESKRLLCSPWRRNEPLDEHEELPLPSPAHRELLDAVLRLKPKYRTAIYLHYYEGMSTQEIADALGLPQNTVLTHLRRAREQLKSEWTED